jgi:Barstar (barnase inhibitor)
MRTVTVPVEKIVDWPSFHETFQRELGFPDFYGRNMDAWIDCMTSVDTPSDGMTTLTVQPGELLVLRMDNPFEFRRRCPEQYDALVECTAFVNFRRVGVGELPVLALLYVGRSQ